MNFKPVFSGRIAGLVLSALLMSLLTACSDKPPLKIGFLGGVSGRVADLGIGGRNGALLALEMKNAQGGIDGRQLMLISEDDEQDETRARAALSRLIEQKVEAVIGPMTSSMAVAVVQQANQAKMLLLSPTATTTSLSGQDDYFMRVIAATTAYARKSAAYHYQNLGIRKVAVIYDIRNRAYTESWLHNYRKSFEGLAGQIIKVVPFSSGEDVQFSELVVKSLDSSADSVLIIANSVDTALLAQQLRRLNPTIFINTSEWAATEQLLELGGKAVEGISVAQFLDRDSTQPEYIEFRQAYLERFGKEPGFAGLTGFDAANVLIQSLSEQQDGQSLKETILRIKVFQGAQSTLTFDANGDADRKTYLTTITDGQFQRIR